MRILRSIATTVIFVLGLSLTVSAQWNDPSDTPPQGSGPWQSSSEVTPPALPDDPELVPIGGLLLLLAAGVGYGVYRLRRRDGTPPEEA